MSKSKEVCILPDGRPVKFLLQQRVGRDPVYQVRFVGPDKLRVERSTKCANLKAARDTACRIIRDEYSPKSNFPNIPWDEAVAKMKAAMKAQNLRERSIVEYVAVISTLRKVFPTSRGPCDITDALAKQFKLARQQESLALSPRTVVGNICNLSIIWGKWFRDDLRVLDKNPWDAVELPKLDKPTPRFIEPEEQQAFLGWLSKRWNGWRLPILFLEVKGLIGCRVLELCAVKTGDFRDGRLTFEAVTTKGRKTRKAKLPESICRELDALAGPTFLWERYAEQLREFHRQNPLLFDIRPIASNVAGQHGIAERFREGGAIFRALLQNLEDAEFRFAQGLAKGFDVLLTDLVTDLLTDLPRFLQESRSKEIAACFRTLWRCRAGTETR